MKRWANQDILGIAVEDEALRICQLRPDQGDGRIHVVRAAVTPLPSGQSLDETPQVTGDWLQKTLRREGFTARRAVFGLSVDWLLIKSKTLPPADDAAALEMLRLAAEREFAIDSRELCVDCLLDDHRGETTTRRVLLVAALNRKVEAIRQLAKAAGIKTIAVTPSLMALSEAAQAAGDGQELLLRITPSRVELALRQEEGVTMIRRLSAPGPSASEDHDADAVAPMHNYENWSRTLVSELRRITAGLAPGAGSSTPTLSIWDGAGLPGELTESISRQLSMTCAAQTDLSLLGVVSNGQLGFKEAHSALRFADAAALALSGLTPELATNRINFIQPRLAVTEKSHEVRRRWLWRGGAIAAVIVAVFGADVSWKMYRIAQMQSSLLQNAETIEQTQKLNNTVRFARRWYDQRPAPVTALAALSQAFPPYEPIWTTSVTIREDQRITVVGKAANENLVQDLLNTLRADMAFEDEQQGPLRKVDQDEYSFLISLTYNPKAPR